MNLQESITMTKKWTVRRYADHAAFEAGMPTPVVDASTGELLPAISEVIGNLLLNEGIGELLDLACGLGKPIYRQQATRHARQWRLAIRAALRKQ